MKNPYDEPKEKLIDGMAEEIFHTRNASEFKILRMEVDMEVSALKMSTVETTLSMKRAFPELSILEILDFVKKSGFEVSK